MDIYNDYDGAFWKIMVDATSVGVPPIRSTGLTSAPCECMSAE